MSLPYTPHFITKLLRDMPDERLREATPVQFQTWPAKHIVPAAIIAELINNERSSRRV